MNNFKHFALACALVFGLSAQASQAQTSVTHARRGLATVIFCGLGGAILGISTLSFYGDPQNHIGNITTGLGLGLIGGTVMVAMQSSDAARENSALDPLKELQQRGHMAKTAPFAWRWEF